MTLRLRLVVAPVLAAVAGGCATMRSRVASANDACAVARAAAGYYVNDAGDDTCVVAILQGEDGTPTYASAGGADEHSMFRIASLSKLFLYPVILELHKRGRIDLDKPITAYSRLDLPPECENVTLRDLVENKSGLPREFLNPLNPIDMWTAFSCGFVGSHIYADFDSRDDFVRELWSDRWRGAMRKGGRIYSNMGFGLLGMTVEDAIGKDLETILSEELTAPREMNDTAYNPRPDQTNRVTRTCAGHLPWLVRRHNEVPDHRLGPALRATGGLLSSASDCMKLFRSAWPLIDSHVKDRPLESYPDEAIYGLLRVHVLSNGRRVLYRSGMIYGGASFVGYDPSTRTVVLILRNVTSWPDSRGFDVMERLEAISGR